MSRIARVSTFDGFGGQGMIHQEQTGAGPSAASAIQGQKDAAAARALNPAGYDAMNADSQFTLAWWTGKPWLGRYPSASRAQLESYFKYLPDETRGHVVPAGYPLHATGFDLQGGNFFPRIATLSNTDPNKATVTWVPIGTNTGYYNKPITLAAFKKLPGVVEIKKGVTWYYPKGGVYATYEPHALFDKMLLAEKLFADPLAPYWENEFRAWQEPTYLGELRDAAIHVAIAFGIAYGAAALTGQGAAAGGSGSALGSSVDAAPSLAPTDTSAFLTAPEASAPIAQSSFATVGTEIAPVAAPTAAVGTGAVATTAAAGGSGALSTVASAAPAVLKTVGTVAAANAAQRAAQAAAQGGAPGAVAPPAGNSGGGGLVLLAAAALGALAFLT